MLMMRHAAGPAAASLALANPLPSVSLREALVETAQHPRVRIARDEKSFRRICELRFRQHASIPASALAVVRALPTERLDARSVNVYVEDESGIVCALQVNDLADRHGGQLDFLLRLADQLGLARQITLTCSQLATAPHRGGLHIPELIRFVRLQAVRAGWRYCIMQSTERLVPFFQRFGFDETGLWSIDPVAGCLQVLLLDTQNRASQGKP